MWYDDQVSFLEGHLDENTIIGGGSTLKVAGMDPLGHGTIFDGNNYIYGMVEFLSDVRS